MRSHTPRWRARGLVLSTGVACALAQVTWAEGNAAPPVPLPPATETETRDLPPAATPMPAVPIGGLAGQELRPMGDLAGLATAVMGSVLGGNKGNKADIVRVVVLEDTESLLRLRVSTRNGGGASIFGRIRDANGQLQNQFNTFRYEIPPNAIDQDLEFRLSDSVPTQASLESGSVVLYIARSGGNFAMPDSVRTYYLPKRWEKPVDVRLDPVGAAAQLPTTRGVDPLPEPPSSRAAPQPAAGIATRGGSNEVWVGEGPPPTQERAAPGGVAVQPLNRIALANVARILPQIHTTPPAPPDLTAKGPGNVKISLLSEISASISGFQEKDLTNAYGWVYQDKNPDSGIYYYLPRRYDLSWDPTNGHYLRVDYKAASDAGAAGGVVLAATLRTGIDSTDIELMKQLLLSYPGVAGHAVRLQPVPPGAAPTIVLQEKTWGAPADRIVASDRTEDVQIAWATTSTEVENLRIALRGEGIQGNLVVPIGESGDTMNAPVSVGLASTATFGRMTWKRDAAWQNQTPYPLRLNYVHALTLQGGRPVVYSWQAGAARVPPGAFVRFDATRVPTWLDSGPQAALRTWIAYSVESNCEACDKVAMAPVTGGVSQTSAQHIVFHTLSLLSRSGASRVKIQVRSLYLDPNKREMAEMASFTLDADDKNFTAPQPIYQPPAGERTSGPLFEYRLSLVMPDGSKYDGQNWVGVDALSDEYEISAEDVRKSLGFLPKDRAEASGAAN